MDEGTPVTEDYQEGDNRFTGTIHKVTIDLKELKAASAEAAETVVREESSRKALSD